MAIIIQWMDLLWLPISFLMVHKHQRIWAIGLVASCIIMLRMQVELMVGIDAGNGITGLIGMSVLNRGQIIYSLFYVVFLLLAYYSPGSRGIIVMASAISMFFMAFFTSTILMLL